MTRRALNVEAIGKTFKPLWQARSDFQIREAGDHILLFVFELETNAKWVLATEPWSFDKHLVIFSRYDFSIPTRNLRFTTTTFWVQIHGLSMNMLDPETAVEIGEMIGTVSRSKHSNDMVRGDFLRVRVEVDVTKSLCKGQKIAINSIDVAWAAFKYEKLPNFWCWCGRVSHLNKECEIWLANKETLNPDQQEYGAWLQASSYNAGKISFAIVSGMGDGFRRSRSRISATRKSQDQANTSQQQASDKLSEYSQGGDCPSRISAPRKS